ncbi:hypothetical protein DCAR_0626525 [Daucus carota subsp. sativus]|uniref:RIN4 pathogenic type III effector avirulence factor Avr cleavage site domain-containing protein n=1 Tax=Daucus carota subsp. sativus TaxID=79200 RepID=A0A161WVP0_DAUCS|nr:hypothetical protein DCAR_0626525 [Daucus carota subsp. sativus]
MANRGPVALPKFGEWDLKNPGQAEFSVIFEKARNAKKEGNRHKFNPDSPVFKKEPEQNPFADQNGKGRQSTKRRRSSCARRWFCCCCSGPKHDVES